MEVINKNHQFNIQKRNWETPLQNSFSKLPVDNCIMNDDNDDTYMQINHRINVCNHKNDNKSRVYVNRNPEKKVLPLRNETNPLVNNKKERKIAILSDSITKPIDMNEFSHLILNGFAI